MKEKIWKLLELYRNYLTDEIKKEMYVNWADKECIDMFEADEVEEERLYKFLNQLSVLKKFVKWLVENDKINRDKKEIEKSDYDITFTWALTMDKKSDLDIMVDTLLMLISISDTPIEDLLLYLK